MVSQTFNQSPTEVETGRSSWVWFIEQVLARSVSALYWDFASKGVFWNLDSEPIEIPLFDAENKFKTSQHEAEFV